MHEIVPAPGRRNAFSGDPVDVGNHGYNWSSDTGGIGSVDLYFSTKHLNPQDGPSRAYGLQLRCLSE
ncbi:hypothetical protein [uncultured Rikenella sp.]|uniref:hypothetical protein n=1 Tax=uncultured Rikenella sp. TaxID=368003 RepID=UPI0025FA8AB5|nr:hypothetical protein [uncultured Rikenella sp.]